MQCPFLPFLYFIKTAKKHKKKKAIRPQKHIIGSENVDLQNFSSYN